MGIMDSFKNIFSEDNKSKATSGISSGANYNPEKIFASDNIDHNDADKYHEYNDLSSRKKDSGSSHLSQALMVRQSEALVYSGTVLAGKIFQISPDVIALIDAAFARQYNILPIELANNTLTIASIDGLAIHPVERQIQQKYNYKVIFVKGGAELISSGIEYNYGEPEPSTEESIDSQSVLTEYTSRLRRLQYESDAKEFDGTDIIFNFGNISQRDDSIVKDILETMLCKAHKDNASDIHFDLMEYHPDQDEFVRFRTYLLCRYTIDGQFVEVYRAPMTLENYRRLPRILKNASPDLDSVDQFTPQTGVVTGNVNYNGRSVLIQFRCQFMAASETRGESITIRIQEPTKFNFNLDNIGLLPCQADDIEKILDNKIGVTLITGPTGQGKNTTAGCLIVKYKMLDWHKKIITLEDPIEIILYHDITQINVGVKRGKAADGKKYEFSDFLPAILRSSPNYIYYGETRTPETAKAVFETAYTGHACLSTLHTNDAVATIDRLLALGVERDKIANLLKAVMSQRLVRRNCANCEQVEEIDFAGIDRSVIESLANRIEWSDEIKFYRSTGVCKDGSVCRVCQGKGLVGRIALIEILTTDRRISKLIRDGRDTSLIRDVALEKRSFRSFWMLGLEHALRQNTSLSEIIRALGKPDLHHEGVLADTCEYSDRIS